MDTPECTEQQQVAHSPIPLEQSISDNPPSSTAEKQQIPHEQIISDDSPTAADVSVPDSTFLSVPNSSFATCKDGFESFHSCISDSSDGPCDQSDLEKTVVASTPNKTRPNASHGHELIESLESLQGIKPTDSSVDIMKSNPEIPELFQSGSVTERVSYDPTPEVLKTESSVDVLEDNGGEDLPSKGTSSIYHPEDSSIDILPTSSSINVIGSSENLPDHNIKIRNSLSNDTTVSIRSSVSSIAVLGTSSQSQDFTLPYSLQEGPDSAEDEAFDEVPESSTLADEEEEDEEDEEERIGPGVLDVCQEVMTTSLETVGTEVSQEARSLETIVSPSVPSGMQNQVQCISPIEVVAGFEKDCNPELNENLEVNLKKSSSQGTDSNSDNLQESQVLKDTSPSANKTEENVVPVLAKTERTVAPATEEIEKTAAPAVQETEETAAHYVQEIEKTVAPSVQEKEQTAAPSVEEIEETAAPSVQEIEKTAAPSVQGIEETASPSVEEIKANAAPASEKIEETAVTYVEKIVELETSASAEQTVTHSVQEMEKTLAPPPEKIEQTPAPPPDEVKQATDLNQGDMENIGNFSPESSQSHEPEIVRNMYPQVVIKPSLQIAEGDIEVLKIMEPVEYSSSVESTPSSELPPSVTSREHKVRLIHLRNF